MFEQRIHAALAVAVLIAPLAVLAAACSRPAEQQFLTQFFRAARGRDNTTLAMMSAVPFDPREKGSVESFEIKQVTPEKRTPLNFKSLVEAERKATQDEADFRQRKIEYQNANMPALAGGSVADAAGTAALEARPVRGRARVERRHCRRAGQNARRSDRAEDSRADHGAGFWQVERSAARGQVDHHADSGGVEPNRSFQLPVSSSKV